MPTTPNPSCIPLRVASPAASLLMALAACTHEVPPTEGPVEGTVETIRGGEPVADSLVVDVADVDRAWLFDGRSASLRLDDVLLVSPTGSWARLDIWLGSAARREGFELDWDRSLFSIGRREPIARDAIERETGCEAECSGLGDTLVCTPRCGGPARSPFDRPDLAGERVEREPWNPPPRSRSGGDDPAGDAPRAHGSGGEGSSPSSQPLPSF